MSGSGHWPGLKHPWDKRGDINDDDDVMLVPSPDNKCSAYPWSRWLSRAGLCWRSPRSSPILHPAPAWSLLKVLTMFCLNWRLTAVSLECRILSVWCLTMTGVRRVSAQQDTSRARDISAALACPLNMRGQSANTQASGYDVTITGMSRASLLRRKFL